MVCLQHEIWFLISFHSAIVNSCVCRIVIEIIPKKSRLHNEQWLVNIFLSDDRWRTRETHISQVSFLCFSNQPDSISRLFTKEFFLENIIYHKKDESIKKSSKKNLTQLETLNIINYAQLDFSLSHSIPWRRTKRAEKINWNVEACYWFLSRQTVEAKKFGVEGKKGHWIAN